MRLVVRQLVKEDFGSYRRLFDEAYYEYLEDLKQSNLPRYRKELQDKRKVTSSRFNFYLKTGSSFAAEKKGEVIGYVASQTVNYQHGVDKLLWIEYIVTKKEHRRRGIATLLLKKLIDHAKHEKIDRIYTTINPDNTASIKLHQKLDFNVKNWKTASLQTGR
jgi:RimJ/RimL family protein N-acetyltransferase